MCHDLWRLAGERSRNCGISAHGLRAFHIETSFVYFDLSAKQALLRTTPLPPPPLHGLERLRRLIFETLTSFHATLRICQIILFSPRFCCSQQDSPSFASFDHARPRERLPDVEFARLEAQAKEYATASAKHQRSDRYWRNTCLLTSALDNLRAHHVFQPRTSAEHVRQRVAKHLSLTTPI